MRTTERLRGNNWEPCSFSDLKPGDWFRLFQNGQQVINEKGQKEWRAAGRPYTNKEGILTVEIFSQEEDA